MHGDHVADLQQAPATQLHDAVDHHLAALDEQLGVSARGSNCRDLEKRSQRQRAVDDDLVQLLSLIGMMR